MIKTILKVFGALVLLMVVFTFLPTELSRDDVVEGYNTTLDYSDSEVSNSLAYQFQESLVKQAQQEATNQGAEGHGDLRQVICQFATTLSERYSRGSDEHTATQLFYSLSGNSCTKCGQAESASYTSYAKCQQNIVEIAADSNVHKHFSCAAFASYCWGAVWQEAQGKFSAGATSLYERKWTTEWEDITSSNFETLKPGDMVSSGKHAMLYIGEYTTPDGTVWKHAVCHASEPGAEIKVNNWKYKSGWKVIRLEKCIQAVGSVTISDDYKTVLPDVTVTEGGVLP